MARQYLKILPYNNFIIIILTVVKISKAILILSPEIFYLVHMNKVHFLGYYNLCF